MGGLYQGFPGVRGTFVPGSTDLGQFMIYPHFIDVSEAQDVAYYGMAPNRSDKTSGIVFDLRRVNTPAGGASEYIRVIYTAYETGMRPGFAFAFAPDVTSGTVATETSGNVQYKKITDGTSYAEWLIPATFTGAIDKVIYFPNSATDATFDLIRNRGGVTTTVASNVSPNSSYLNPQTVSLSSTLTGGDYLRWKKNGAGTAYVASMQAYDSTGTCSDPRQHFIPTTPAILATDCWIASSSSEDAWALAPTGSTAEYVGGYAHQGPAGTFGQEYPATETWTKAGLSWTPTGGQQVEQVILTREATLYYNVSNTNLGTLTTQYIFKSDCLRVENKLVTAVAIDSGELLWAMLPISSANYTNAGYTVDGITKEEFTKAQIVSAGSKFFTSSTGNPAYVYYYQTAAGKSICQYAMTRYGTINNRYANDKGGNNAKTYNVQNPYPSASGTGAGATYGGAMEFFLDSATGPTL